MDSSPAWPYQGVHAESSRQFVLRFDLARQRRSTPDPTLLSGKDHGKNHILDVAKYVMQPDDRGRAGLQWPLWAEVGAMRPQGRCLEQVQAACRLVSWKKADRSRQGPGGLVCERSGC